MKKLTVFFLFLGIFQFATAQFVLDSCMYSLIGLERNDSKVQYFIEKTGLHRSQEKIYDLTLKNDTYSLTMTINASNKVQNIYMKIYTAERSVLDLPILDYFGHDTSLVRSIDQIPFPISDTFDYSFMKRMKYIVRPEPDLRAELGYSTRNTDGVYFLTYLSLNTYAPASYCESCYPESAGFGMAEIEKEPIKEPASIWKYDYIKTESFDSVCELFNYRIGKSDWFELVAKHGFSEKRKGDDFSYTSKDGKLKIASNEYNFTRIKTITIYTQNPDDIGFIKDFKQFKKETYGYKNQQWNHDWFSVLCYSGDPKNKYNLYFVTFYTPNEKDVFTYLTIEPLYYYKYNYTEPFKTLTVGCLEGNCDNGVGYFRWTNGLSFKGEFENSKPVEGYYYLFHHGDGVYDSISRKEILKNNLDQLMQQAKQLEAAIYSFRKELEPISKYALKIDKNEGNRSENRENGLRHLEKANKKLYTVRREAQYLLDELHRSGLDCPKAYDRISSIGGDFIKIQNTFLTMRDYFNGKALSEDELEDYRALGGNLTNFDLLYIYDQLNACMKKAISE